jgi:hypothetical protein
MAVGSVDTTVASRADSKPDSKVVRRVVRRGQQGGQQAAQHELKRRSPRPARGPALQAARRASRPRDPPATQQGSGARNPEDVEDFFDQSAPLGCGLKPVPPGCGSAGSAARRAQHHGHRARQAHAQTPASNSVRVHEHRPAQQLDLTASPAGRQRARLGAVEGDTQTGRRSRA